MGHPTLLSERTTLRVGGPADRWVVAVTDDGVVDAVRAADAAGDPVLVLGGGSNLLVADDGFRGTVVEVATRGQAVIDVDGGVELGLAAGEPWDDVVATAVAHGWTGIDALSGIPGLVGATPIQNVGAYGQEVAQVVTSVRAVDRRSGAVVELTADECGFGYRTSTFKRAPDRWVVLGVRMRLGVDPATIVRYAELARELGVSVGDVAAPADVRAGVLSLRRRKGMVLDNADHDTWSAGSFFTNPVVGPDVDARIPADCPRYPAPDGAKLSAAWLIEQSGVGRGFALAAGAPAAISAKHTLALTNRGGATAADVVALAARVRDTVEHAFGVRLAVEPTLVGVSV